MNLTKALILVAFAIVLGVPFLFRPASVHVEAGTRRVVIVTPHNEQIRTEFGHAFNVWHQARYGEPAQVVWLTPGGTSEIRRMLISVYTSAMTSGKITPAGELANADDTMDFDIMFGGGTYEHKELAKMYKATTIAKDEQGNTVRDEEGKAVEQVVELSLSVPVDFSDSALEAIYGENIVGRDNLYDPDKHWFGTALSGFGIVYNRDVLEELGVDEPTTWDDLTDPKLRGWVALADPRHSGSVTTTYDAILNQYGWDEGWRILRGMAGNALYFSNSSSKIPIDVSQGEAAVGVAIDFYGRYQAQAVMEEGETPETSRVGYIDPPGQVLIDPDPISKLRSGPDPEMAERFIAFALSEDAQTLWQFRAGESAQRIGSDASEILLGTAHSGDRAISDPELVAGPQKYELRRMPIRRVMYERYADAFVDLGIDPFAAASDAPYRGWRSALAPMMGAASINVRDEQRAAWDALHDAKERGAAAETIAQMEELFYAWPVHALFGQDARHMGGAVLPMNGETFRGSGDIGDLHRRLEAIPKDTERSDDEHAAWRIDLIYSDAQFERLGNPIRKRVAPYDVTFTDFGVRDLIWRKMDDVQRAHLQIAYTEFFKSNYERVVELGSEVKQAAAVQE